MLVDESRLAPAAVAAVSAGRGAAAPGGPKRWVSLRRAPSAAAFAFWCWKPSPSQPRHGYEIIQHIEQRAGGSYRPSPGVIYPTLQMLEELEHARVVEQDGKKGLCHHRRSARPISRRIVATVDEFYARFTEDQPWESYAEDFAELMKRVGRLMTTFRKGAHRGRMSPATMRDHSSRAGRGAAQNRRRLERPSALRARTLPIGSNSAPARGRSTGVFS